MTETLIFSILGQMIELIRYTSSSEWLYPLESLLLESNTDEKETARKILGLYGGAGSLNDIILYKDNTLLIAATTEFSALRKRLFEACKNAL